MEPGTSPRIVTSKRKIVYRKSLWNVHQFQAWSGELIGWVAVLKMTDSLLVWAGRADERRLGELSLGMPAAGGAGEALSTTLVESEGGAGGAAGRARRLAAALRRPVLAAGALPLDRFTAPLLERALADEIRRVPEIFRS